MNLRIYTLADSSLKQFDYPNLKQLNYSDSSPSLGMQYVRRNEELKQGTLSMSNTYPCQEQLDDADVRQTHAACRFECMRPLVASH